ncbi:12343_t:CDS:2 [Entrophospora sp. SA101]|nr:12343_t:CDS:2 [Entrophospora sp. SA101]
MSSLLSPPSKRLSRKSSTILHEDEIVEFDQKDEILPIVRFTENRKLVVHETEWKLETVDNVVDNNEYDVDTIAIELSNETISVGSDNEDLESFNMTNFLETNFINGFIIPINQELDGFLLYPKVVSKHGAYLGIIYLNNFSKKENLMAIL